MTELVNRLMVRARIELLRVGNRSAYSTLKWVKRQGLTYLSYPELIDLYESVKQVERNEVPGILVEAGCALGGSALVITATKNPERPFRVYDVFARIPPPSEQDEADAHARYATIASGQSDGIKGKRYYGYEDDLRAKVIASFQEAGLAPEENSVELIAGMYQDALHISHPIALAHIDCDWYDSVLTCLERISPWISEGGRLIIDDYYSFAGCRKA